MQSFKIKIFILTVLFILCSFTNLFSCQAKDVPTEFSKRVGTILGDVDNETIYRRFSKGQCTWYAWGRFKEIHKKELKFSKKSGIDAKLWPELVINATVNKNIQEKSIGVKPSGKYGHLIFIEHIVGKDVYYTDANADNNNLFDRDSDCILRKTTLDSEFMQSFKEFIHP